MVEVIGAMGDEEMLGNGGNGVVVLGVRLILITVTDSHVNKSHDTTQ